MQTQQQQEGHIGKSIGYFKLTIVIINFWLIIWNILTFMEQIRGGVRKIVFGEPFRHNLIKVLIGLTNEKFHDILCTSEFKLMSESL